MALLIDRVLCPPSGAVYTIRPLSCPEPCVIDYNNRPALTAGQVRLPVEHQSTRESILTWCFLARDSSEIYLQVAVTTSTLSSTMASIARTAFRRFLSSSSRTSQTAYPFSKTALIPPVPEAPVTPALQKGKGLMEFVNKTLVTPEKRQIVETLFSRRSSKQLLPGSIVSVTQTQAPVQFTGVLIAIRRRGFNTSFRLRNVLNRTGVEMQFFVNSPHLKDIKLVRPPPGGRMRRAKLYYLRDAPDKMSQLAGGKK